MTGDARASCIKKRQLCLNCFARGHQLRECQSAHSCFTCGSRHHTLLHFGTPASSESTSTTAENTASSVAPPNPFGTLGIRWKATSDEFFFLPPVLTLESSYTKREAVCPAGWLVEIWLQELGWDEHLPNALYQRWLDFLQSHAFLPQIKIPRWIGAQPPVKIDHHGFCDASEKAYGAAIYVRVECDQHITVNLLSAKARVAPVKAVSVPRLELCGAVLLSEMATAILPSMPTESPQCYYWTDSTIVLAWLNKPACHWTTFVANRVTKIAQTTGTKDWAHVRSEHNPADLASRGVALQELVDNQLWWHGPAWLQSPRDQWPTQADAAPIMTLEQRSVKVHFVPSPSKDFLDRFSQLERALRGRAYVLRFIQCCRKVAPAGGDPLSSAEINEAERPCHSFSRSEV
ncbi:uncharacterized protein LOC121404687 [Drosophila obscura]|uniref:uncharacterized protein LOC121404687 n=1 Tax=Drosophila obscura TaxID=7282 RepID=UPI001BB154F0|nr:uncharacterized protein LOC121404687 [Drosophila obscura]